MKPQTGCQVLITGGGTAGHTNPGIAVAQALVRAGLPAEEIHFVGGERGNEGELVPAAGFSIDLLPGRGIQRRLTMENVASIQGLLRGLKDARTILSARQPSVVLCLGGYAAAGASLAAIAARIPLVVSEQNAKASAVNRMVGRFAKVCALPYPDTDLPHGELTGNPIRQSVVQAVQEADRVEARMRLGLPPDRVALAVWSGSLGARSVNRAVRDLAVRWSDRSDVAIYHVVGRRDWADFRDPPAELGQGAPLRYVTVDYEDRMPALLAAADLAVCRAGASTTAELAVAGLPSLLIPLPGAPRDHQRANSQELVTAGGALRLADDDLSATTLAAKLEPLLEDAISRKEMADAAASVGRPGAADDVARILLDTGGINVG